MPNNKSLYFDKIEVICLAICQPMSPYDLTVMKRHAVAVFVFAFFPINTITHNENSIS